MFEAAELGSTLPKALYRARAPRLRTDLLDAQRRLRDEARFPVIIVFAGVDGAGKSETVHLLNEWMDPRWLVTTAFGEPSDEELERPEFWRYWRALPPRGRVGFYLSSWYSGPLLDRVYRRIKPAEFDDRLNRIAQFEHALAEDGALILKFWMHLSRGAHRKRLKKLENDPLTRWRVNKLQWRHWQMRNKFIVAAERIIERTSTGRAPWTIVEGLDPRYRTMTIVTAIRDAIRDRLSAAPPPREESESSSAGRLRAEGASASSAEALAEARARASGGGVPASTKKRGQRRPAKGRTILEHLDMSQKIGKDAFEKQLEERQGRLNRLHRKSATKGITTILVFEGWDAAGKGGAIRRVTGALDARASRVVPIAAPTDEERAHHYLWRFWRHLPRQGLVTIFDRSWYGRVLVERVEGFATPAEWQRAFREINAFEEQLVDHGIVLVKYWLHVTPEEQLRRFKDRERSSFKSWKLTDEDWRNRGRWNDYAAAVNEMVERTSTYFAPWTIVEANDKYFARIKVLDTVCNRLTKALK